MRSKAKGLMALIALRFPLGGRRILVGISGSMHPPVKLPLVVTALQTGALVALSA